ncbi:MAG TPA: arylesterase [Nitrosomonas sp.]|nr:arylesterase [Nitrosomonas sp.]HQX13765.1 arylesterase [Nitrosomonas sp.]HRB21869.1 arylesterase [Nitrosomonas sp.]HRB32444.1 arylesterase [Nitrosomonas sp.]HRB45283.1 arylesterase [Nitrosomonas sp.]
MKKNVLFSLLLLVICMMPVAKATATKILVYGDSLSANYGIPIEAGWVSLLTQRINNQYTGYQIINTSISGETTLGGRNRIDQVLSTHKPNIIIVELGANDGLRGTSIQSIYDNLATIIQKSQRNNARVLLVGMRLPPNYGATYTAKFQDTFTKLAKDYQIPLVPFLFEGFGERSDFFLPDRLHPNEMAQPKIVETIWPALEPLLTK